MAFGMEYNPKADIVGGASSICVKEASIEKKKKKCIRLLFSVHPTLSVVSKLVELLDKGDANVDIKVKTNVKSNDINNIQEIVTKLQNMGIDVEVEIKEAEKDKATFFIDIIISSPGKTSREEIKLVLDTELKNKETLEFEVKKLEEFDRIVWKKKSVLGDEQEGEIKVIDGVEFVKIKEMKYNTISFIQDLENFLDSLKEYLSRDKKDEINITAGLMDEIRNSSKTKEIGKEGMVLEKLAKELSKRKN